MENKNMLTFSRFETFEQVEAFYNRIKPVREDGYSTSRNIRPIGDRSRKRERIIKVNNNTYALSDGYHYGDAVYTPWPLSVVTPKQIVRYAPIVWHKGKRQADGTYETTVTLRNGCGVGAHLHRYAFLYRHTPRNMVFRNRNGKHFIDVNGQEYFIAKDVVVPEPVYQDYKSRPNRWTEWAKSRGADPAVTFKLDRTGIRDAWVFVGEAAEVPKPPRFVVDKQAKAKMKDVIDSFRSWAFTMYPMLPQNNHEYNARLRSELREKLVDVSWNPIRAFQQNWYVSRRIISDANHPLRVHLMYHIMGETNYYNYRGVQCDPEAARHITTKFNSVINRVCNFRKQVEE
jgi:hypothetical protein